MIVHITFMNKAIPEASIRTERVTVQQNIYLGLPVWILFLGTFPALQSYMFNEIEFFWVEEE